MIQIAFASTHIFEILVKCFVLPCLLLVMKPIFATSGFPTPGCVTAMGAVFVIVVMVAAAGAGIIREVMTHLLITGQIATFTVAFWQFLCQISNKQKSVQEHLLRDLPLLSTTKENNFNLSF